MPDLPDDLQDLFNQLDDKAGNPAEDITQLESLPSTPDALRPSDTQLILEQPPTEDEAAALPIEIAEYRDQLKTVTQEVLDATRSDRKETQDVIDMLRALVVVQGNTPSKACVDGLVKALEVKANTQQNAIRIMEVNAKFMTAIKPSVRVNQNLTISPEDLDRALNNPPGELD